MAMSHFTNDQLYAMVAVGQPTWSGIDSATRAFYDAHKEAMLAETAAGERMRNEFYQDLINKIARPRFTDATMRNQLSILKSENVYLADMTEDIIVAPAKGQNYGQTNGRDNTENRALENTNPFDADEPVIKASYQATNRNQKYSVGYKAINLAKAIHEGAGTDLDRMLNLIVKTLSEGNTRDEYILCKRLINSALNSKDFPLQDTQKITLDYDIRDPNMTADLQSTQMAKVEQAVTNLRYNNSGYNAQKVERATSIESMRVIINKNAMITNRFKSLSFIYNPNLQNSGLSNFIEVDDFGEGNENVVMLAVDNQALRYHDRQNTLGSIYNPSTSRLNVWYLLQQIYTYNPAGQMMVFYAPASQPPIPSTKGEKGDKGDKGDTGPAGAPGALQSVEAGDGIAVTPVANGKQTISTAAAQSAKK